MRNSLRSFWFILSVSFRADATRTVLALAASIVATFSRAAGAWITSRMIGAIVEGDGDRALTMAVALAATAAAGMATAIMRLDLRFRMEEATSLLIESELIALMAGVPGLEQHERPEHLDRLELLHKERRSLGGAVGALIENVGVFSSVASTAALLATVDPRLLLLPLAGLPAIATTAWRRNLLKRVEDDTAEPLRAAKHLFQLATSGPPAKELRVFGLRHHVRDRYIGILDDVHGRFDTASIRIALVTTLTWTLFALAYVGTLYFVVREAVSGRASTADVVLVSSLSMQVNEQVNSIYWTVTWLFEMLKTVSRYLVIKDESLAAAAPVPSPAPAPDRLTDGIELRGVGFRYPGTDVEVLHDVSLRLPAGSTIAVVGDNGAGKSTLMKLLCGFYAPTEGAVLIDGVDLRAIPPDEWRSRMAAGFQDFAKLELLCRETVGVGDLVLVDDSGAVMGALDRASAADVVINLSDGLETQVGRQFEGGVELSGGQWQKLALGRAMMRGRPLLLVLDEPTAALDADTEHALFERYAGAARAVAAETGGVTVLVSHRFSTVRMADLIVVVGDGTIEESGTHEELMARGGVYAELFEMQARAYR